MPTQSLIGVDVGGTFTDCIAFEDGKFRALKVPTNPDHEEMPVVEGAGRLGLRDAAMFNHASTVGLNALLTRQLPKVAYLTTEGHRDVPDIGRTLRPLEVLTDPGWRRPFGDAGNRPLVPRYLRRGVKERITHDGSVLISLDRAQAREQLTVLKTCNVQGVAICLINSFANPEHEVMLRELAREVLGPDIPCSISSDISPLAKEYPRASTTITNVFMKSTFGKYAVNLHKGLQSEGFAGETNFVDCAATLLPEDLALEEPHRLIFSGPAAGTRSSAYWSQLINQKNLICADVGGTSTDFSIVTDGNPLVNTSFEVEHDLVVSTLANEFVSVGAGGGSIVSVTSNGEIQVGPASAGANPGPACYGRGGADPTLTDACLLIGLLNEGEFLGGEMQLDRGKAQEAFEALAAPVPTDERIRHAYWLGVNHLSEAINNMGVRYGIDPRDYSIMAYGSAGPMLLPPLLEVSGVKAIVVPPQPGLFSALGVLSTDHVYTDSRSAYMVLKGENAKRINEIYGAMEDALLTQAQVERDKVTFLRTFDARLVGQTWEMPFVPLPDGEITQGAVEQMVANFHRAYEERRGNRFDVIPVEGVTYRVQLTVPTEKVTYDRIEHASGPRLKPEPSSYASLRYLDADAREVQSVEYHREDLGAEYTLEGPAIIREPAATTQVCVGQRATIGPLGEIMITRSGEFI